jgi:hypothetical protein
VYAYERVLTTNHGKKIRASRTWQMIERRGIIPAVEHVEARSAESTGYKALIDMACKTSRLRLSSCDIRKSSVKTLFDAQRKG